MVYAQPSTCPRKWHTQTPIGLWYTNGLSNHGQKTRPYNYQQKKKICKIVDFAVPADHRIKLKECEKRDKYFDLTRELEKLWNMKVTIIPIVIGAFGMVTKELLKGLEDLEVGGWVETIQTTALLKTARILRRFLETWGDLLSLNEPQKATILPVIIGVILTTPNNQETFPGDLESLAWIDTVKTTPRLWLASILRRVLRS